MSVASWAERVRHALEHPDEYEPLRVGERISGFPSDEHLLRWYAHNPKRARGALALLEAGRPARPEPDVVSVSPFVYADQLAAELGVPAADVRAILRRHGRDLPADRVAEIHKEMFS